MTWEQLQIIVLQKMFEIQGDTLVMDDSTTPYVKMMPAAANEAFSILATAGKLLKRTVSIQQGSEEPTQPSFTAGKYNGYDLRELCTDFYSLYGADIWLDDGENYEQTKAYRIEGDSILLLEKDTAGIWKVRYNAYHPRMTKDTPKTTELSFDREACDMVALYMAGQLCKEDEIQRAQIYMNEFATWLEELKKTSRRATNASGGGFYSLTGW
ncbi:hypothetical protein SDC9_127787 [bioreactor metagenome]|uniref:Uncharacterized protein n=1 Tax=bioreactor metagenome TaxID=1076179 RepID=A0A645CUZ3_9ZZZZ|nr:hypothetical protein [Anaerotignum propionicum]MEA5058255.1 hypothetical protein [Anaerotignum propionicum]